MQMIETNYDHMQREILILKIYFNVAAWYIMQLVIQETQDYMSIPHPNI